MQMHVKQNIYESKVDEKEQVIIPNADLDPNYVMTQVPLCTALLSLSFSIHS
jgi:hypothetical protein